jgi:hypothetical protein
MVGWDFNVVILFQGLSHLWIFILASILALCLPGLAQAPQSKLGKGIVCRVASMTYKRTNGQIFPSH